VNNVCMHRQLEKERSPGDINMRECGHDIQQCSLAKPNKQVHASGSHKDHFVSHSLPQVSSKHRVQGNGNERLEKSCKCSRKKKGDGSAECLH